MGWVIEKAISCGIFQRIIVSSEDEEILKTAGHYGAEPFLRSSLLADDSTHVGPVVKDCVESLEIRTESICLLYATAILLQPHHLTEAYSMLADDSIGSVLSVSEFESPIQRCYAMSFDGSINMVFPEFEESRSQDLPKRYRDSGSFYFWKPAHENKKRAGYVIPRHLSVDVDTLEDMQIAISLFQAQGGLRSSV